MKFLVKIIIGLLILAIGAGSASAKSKKAAKPKAKAAAVKAEKEPPRPTAEEITKNFTFIGDFDLKDETRPNSKEIFWRYPTTFPGATFDVKLEKDPARVKALLPLTTGEGRAIEHLNSGRILFLDGKYEEARQTWLSARARYGKTYPYHRRNDYFIASAFLNLAYDYWMDHGKKYDIPELRQNFVNANTFLSSAFDKKRDVPDDFLDQMAPWAFYNQGAIMYNYGRWAAVMGAANNGLDFLRKTGRTEYRREFHRLLAETYIKSQDWLEAVREVDLTLRQDQDPATSAALFARVGDIYFTLNNFELAEEVYEAANRIDTEHKQIRSSQYVLRGESLFWMGRFEEARKNLNYALQGMSLPGGQEVLDDNMQALASLRIADTYLAEKNYEKAKLAYFTHTQEFRGHPTANFAKIRLACLELPVYDGNNIRHARELLAELKDQADKLPDVARELAWTCEMASYAQHDRNPELVERVKLFAQRYPDSELLKSLVAPLREVQSTAIDEYFDDDDPHGAVAFFEKMRKVLYPKVSDDLAKKLFVAYVDIHQSEKSEPFLKAYDDSKPENSGRLRLAVAHAEIAGAKPAKQRGEHLQKLKALSDAFLKEGVFFPRDEATQLSMDRIMDTPGREPFYPWMFKQALHWAEDDISVGCDRVYPMMLKLDENKYVSAELKREAEAFIDKSLKDLLRFETSCAYSMMEYETSHAKISKVGLVNKYLKRDYLPLNATTTPIFWSLAEGALKEGDREAARKVWSLLAEKGDPALPEVRYAKARLDPRKTQLEGLWSH